ncbi:hypothetical protein M569_15404 [Genlisea aurea]|uniref:Uncharacterized protein n=1 Tax=Genlisea aurea TaxID=192259 RepID=S8BXV7_9LAMI|nr:hypothetical protein M569_15404 [Genlisea aurea]
MESGKMRASRWKTVLSCKKLKAKKRYLIPSACELRSRSLCGAEEIGFGFASVVRSHAVDRSSEIDVSEGLHLLRPHLILGASLRRQGSAAAAINFLSSDAVAGQETQQVTNSEKNFILYRIGSIAGI